MFQKRIPDEYECCSILNDWTQNVIRCVDRVEKKNNEENMLLLKYNVNKLYDTSFEFMLMASVALDKLYEQVGAAGWAKLEKDLLKNFAEARKKYEEVEPETELDDGAEEKGKVVPFRTKR